MSRGDGHAEAIAKVSLAAVSLIPAATAQVLQGQGRIDVPSPDGPFGSGLPPFWRLRISIGIAESFPIAGRLGELRSKLRDSEIGETPWLWMGLGELRLRAWRLMRINRALRD